MLRICFVTSECVPFASSGGLGDVAASLPSALSAAGHHCIRVMPYYRQVHERRDREKEFKVEDTGIRLGIPMVGQVIEAELLLLRDRVETYFVKFDGFFDRPGLYGETFGDYHDNIWRFSFFQKAVIALLDHLETPYDIVHCNDWQTGLVPLYLSNGLDGQGRFGREKTVYTIHNLAYQGQFPAHDFYVTGLPNYCFGVNGAEFFGSVNFMKAGLVTADKITTVSPTYAEEIQTDAFGHGMQGLLAHRAPDLTGILNGIDLDTWNPEKDPHIETNYNAKTLNGKLDCKKALLKEFDLEFDPEVPLIGLVSRLAEQKGLPLIRECMPELMKMDVQFVLLGSGNPTYEGWIREWQMAYPGKFAAHIGFVPALAHRIEAGADLFMMPSVFEPCGLNQLYSLRYGTIPVVSNTGGLADTVTAQTGTKNGTGFKMEKYDKKSLLACINDAVKVFANQRRWKPLVRRAMEQDFSWDRSAAKYEALYQELA